MQLRRHARQQLARAERLDQVLVGAGLQTFDARFLAGARRQQHDRDCPGALVGAERRSRPKPSSFGIITSARTKSGALASIRSSAARPSPTASTW